MPSFPLPRRTALAWMAAGALPWPALAQGAGTLQSWKLATSRRTGIHDVAPAPDGGVWFSAQASGHLGWFDPASGRTELVALGSGSSPHGVIQGPDRAAWLTDGGQNAIVRVGWPDRKVTVHPLPAGIDAMTRIFGFLLVCIGMQFLLTGISDFFGLRIAA